MPVELGIALDLADGPTPDRLRSLTRRAEDAGLDVVVLTSSDSGTAAGLDPWTTAVWLAAATDHIQLGIAPPATSADPRDPASSVASVIEKARQSLDLLAGTRVIADPDAWTVTDPDADADALTAVAATGRIAVVPTRTTAEVDRVASLLPDRPRRIGPRRSAAVRSRRRPDIAYDDLPTSLAARAVEPGDEGYGAVRSTYLRGGSPGLVLRPRTTDEVRDAVGFARRHRDLPLGLRSGGHGISGRSTNDGGLVIDLQAMDRIEVLDPDRRLVRIGPGATWKRVAAALDDHGWALSSGDHGGVGVGGLATAGGLGMLARRHGLTIDRLRAVDLVLADGRVVRASEQEHPDLFWAVRGAGANLGVATAFEFEAEQVGDVGWAQLILVAPELAPALQTYGRLASTAPRDTTLFLAAGRPRQGQAVVQVYGIVDDPDPDHIVARLTPFTEVGTLAQQQVVVARYRDVMGQFPDVGAEGHHGFGEPVSRSGFLPAMTPEFARDAAAMLETGAIGFFQLRAMGGAIADVPPEATAFGHRTPAFHVTAMGGDRAQTDAAWDRLARHLDGLYLSFETDPRPERLADAFPPATLRRLREIKRRHDPENLFRDNFNIDPSLEEQPA